LERAEFISHHKDWLERLKKRSCKIYIAKSKNAYEVSKGKHFHLVPEIFFQSSGECLFTFDETSNIVLKKNEILVVPAGIPHGEVGRHTDEDFSNSVIILNNNSINQHKAHLVGNSNKPRVTNSINLIKDAFNHIDQILNTIENLLHSKSSNHVLQHLFSSFCQAMIEHKVKTKKNSMHSKPNGLIDECLAYVKHSYYNSDCNVNQIAKLLNCTPNHLSASFSKRVGHGLNQHINHLKMTEAKKLLSTGQFNVVQTAGACGYDDVSYFVKQFKQHTKMTPKKYSVQVQNS
jgi:YesN/AraC family two-component response regulator